MMINLVVEEIKLYMEHLIKIIVLHFKIINGLVKNNYQRY